MNGYKEKALVSVGKLHTRAKTRKEPVKVQALFVHKLYHEEPKNNIKIYT